MEKRKETLFITRMIGEYWVAHPREANPLCYGIGKTQEEAIGQLWTLFGATMTKKEKKEENVYEY